MSEQVQNPAEEITKEQLSEILQVRRDKLADLQANGKDPFKITKYNVDADTENIKANFGDFEEKTVSIAGRMIARRIMGKASFCTIQDATGKIQAYVRRDDVGEEDYAAFKKYDMKRDSFGSRFGALVAMTGSAVGLGNLWRFPYLVGENGGAAFIIVYILLCFVICLPIFISEFVIGRRSPKNAYAAFRDLSGGTSWRWVGLFTILVPLIVLSYYSVIGGWSIDYLLKSLSFSFTGESRSDLSMMFGKFVSSTWGPLAAHTGFFLMTTV